MFTSLKFGLAAGVDLYASITLQTGQSLRDSELQLHGNGWMTVYYGPGLFGASLGAGIRIGPSGLHLDLGHLGSVSF